MKVGSRSARHVVRVLAFVTLFTAATSACGRKAKAAKHRSEESTAIAAPTPDNTPVPALRTPAGLVLKVEEPAPATTTPLPAPAPAASPNPTP